MLEGKYTADTKFPPTDHRSHRPRSWLLNGIKKNRTITISKCRAHAGQAALQWLLADDRVASTLQIFTTKSSSSNFKSARYGAADVRRHGEIEELYFDNFGVEEEAAEAKGTMERPRRLRWLNLLSLRYAKRCLDRAKHLHCAADRAAAAVGARGAPLPNLIHLVPRPVRRGGFRVVPERAGATGDH